jgi:hypothetical protein
MNILRGNGLTGLCVIGLGIETAHGIKEAHPWLQKKIIKAYMTV